MKFKYVIFFGCLMFFVVVCQDEPPSEEKVPEKLLRYLKRYGYLREGEENEMDSLSDAIKSMQYFGNVEATGKVNQKTLELLDKTRCGLADLEEDDIIAKRYAVSRNKWPTGDLSYWIYSYPLLTEDMSNEDVDNVIEAAFAKWSGVLSNLTFTKNQSHHQIKIAFCNKTHPEDGVAFDGPGRVLGHAYYPRSGKLHFDNDEIWVKTTPKSSMGKQLLYVAVHEIGHSLGLRHTGVDAAVMAPYYKGYNAAFELDEDDINGITSLYG